MVIHLNDDQSRGLERIAAAGGPSVEALAQEAIDSYLLWLQEHVVAVRQGIDAADTGDAVDHATVRDRVERLIAG